MFLKSISNFRGIAILIIVAGHLYVFGLTSDDIISIFVRDLMASGTTLFVFVSGFMFHYIYFKRYRFRQFMTKKFKNVALPYLILGSIAIVFFLIASIGYFKPVNQLSTEEFSNLYELGVFKPNDTKFITILKYYYTGRISTVYWYIPFAMLLFLCSPLHITFIRLKFNNQLMILILLYALALFSQRPLLNLNPFHSLVYFTPMYLIGILTSIYSKNIKKIFNNKLLLMLITIIGLSVIQQYLGQEGAYKKNFFEYGGVDIQLIQKTVLVLFLFVTLEKYTINSKLLDFISETSFAIYFLHPWLIFVLKKVYLKMNILPTDGNNSLLLYIFSLVLVSILSISIALVFKKIFKTKINTRYIIGY